MKAVEEEEALAPLEQSVEWRGATVVADVEGGGVEGAQLRLVEGGRLGERVGKVVLEEVGEALFEPGREDAVHGRARKLVDRRALVDVFGVEGDELVVGDAGVDLGQVVGHLDEEEAVGVGADQDLDPGQGVGGEGKSALAGRFALGGDEDDEGAGLRQVDDLEQGESEGRREDGADLGGAAVGERLRISIEDGGQRGGLALAEAVAVPGLLRREREDLADAGGLAAGLGGALAALDRRDEL